MHTPKEWRSFENMSEMLKTILFVHVFRKYIPVCVSPLVLKPHWVLGKSILLWKDNILDKYSQYLLSCRNFLSNKLYLTTWIIWRSFSSPLITPIPIRVSSNAKNRIENNFFDTLKLHTLKHRTFKYIFMI